MGICLDMNVCRGKDDDAFASKRFGLVLASDCLYDDDASPLFIRTLIRVCQRESLVLLAYKKRIVEYVFFTSMLSWGLGCAHCCSNDGVVHPAAGVRSHSSQRCPRSSRSLLPHPTCCRRSGRDVASTYVHCTRPQFQAATVVVRTRGEQRVLSRAPVTHKFG